MPVREVWGPKGTGDLVCPSRPTTQGLVSEVEVKGIVVEVTTREGSQSMVERVTQEGTEVERYTCRSEKDGGEKGRS